MMKAVRTAGINLALLVVLALLGLAGLELYLRLTVPPSSQESIYEYTLQSRRYKVMRPDASVVAFGKELRTNELGFRDRAPRLAPKAPGEFRVIVLGDSFTVSAGVDYERIYTSLLQERLRQRFPEVRVINLAVGGYNIVQYALVLKEVGLALQPDMILVGMFPDNDFSMETYDSNRRVASGRERADAGSQWYESLYVHRAYLGRAFARIGAWLRGAPPPHGGQTDGWRQNTEALQEIADTARRNGLLLEIALLPHTWHFERQRPLFGRVEAHCRSHGLPCINLLEPLIAAGVEEASLRLNALDAHPNEKYNALIAAQLAPRLAGTVASARTTAPSFASARTTAAPLEP